MRLRKFRVRAYRCIHDSGEIKVGDLAAFVGRNESGKTTILQALTLLNKEERVSDLDLCDEMTEELKSEMIIVDGQFDLIPTETKIIKEKFPHIPDILTLRIFRTNKHPRVQYDFGNVRLSNEQNRTLNSWENYTEKILNFISTIPNHIRIQLDTNFLEGPSSDRATYIREMTEFNNNLQMLASDESQILVEWAKFYKNVENTYDELLVGTTEKTALENFILEYLHPRFVYFSDYKKIYGNINLDEYIKEIKRPEGLEYAEEFDKAETVRNLFYLAELDTEKLEEYKNSPPKLIKLLNVASRRLTDRLNPAWKGDPIHVDLRYNPGNIMSVVISDVHRDGTVTNTGLLSRRAEGFKWTFSFIVNFAAETQKAELKEAILLLDEPARNLHPAQQMGISDLLKNLAGSNQVLYATHSPFMIFDYTPGNLLVVELDKRRHLSKIYYDYWNADDATLIPILYGLSRGLVESIVDREIGTNSRPVIIVETMSDAMYLNAFDKFLEDPNISMNPLNVVAAFSKNSVLPLAIFYRNHGHNVFVILDNTTESKKIAEYLKANEFTDLQIIYLERGGKQIESVEDLILPEDYLHAVNQTYEIKLRKEGYRNLTKEEVSSRNKRGIIEDLRAVWTEHREDGWNEFDVEEIARYVCEKIALKEADFLTDKTKDQFRTLFRLLAERIRLQQNITAQVGITKYQKSKPK
ncbi:MAG: ATP-dependent endonuclease [Candidatus Nitrosotenuis sp.]|nr:ATP-dependent endonuclease [Candidatus Nitrosotenuis sp.]